MAISDIINLVIKNNSILFKEVEKDFDDLIFLIITHQKDVTKKKINISLKSPFSVKYKLRITILERIETPVSLDFSYSYQIYKEEMVLDTNSILNYFKAYGVNFKLFFQYLEESIFEYIYSRKNLLEKFDILEIDVTRSFRGLKTKFDEIISLIGENLMEAKNGFFSIEDLFIYSGKDFSVDSVSIQPEAIENIVFAFKGKGKEGLSYLIQVGDFVSENDFLRKEDKINNPNRNHYLDEINKGNERKYDHYIYNLVIDYGKTDEIESVIVEYNGGIENEVFTLNMEHEINGKKYELIGFTIPIFTLIDDFDLKYISAKNDVDRNMFIDKNKIYKSEIWDYIGFILPDFELISFAYITEPKLVIKIEGNVNQLSEFKRWAGKLFKLYLLAYPSLEKSRFKILIRNLLRFDFKDYGSEEIFNLEKYYPFEIPYDSTATEDYNDASFYLYKKKEKDFLIIRSIDEISVSLYDQNPFQFDHVPISHLNQSIIRIKRKDDLAFTRNNRYVLLKYIYEGIPKNPDLKDSFYQMNKDTNEIIKDLHNFNLVVKEFGILFDVILSKRIVDSYKSLLEDTFSIYAEKEDIKDDIIDSFKSIMCSERFKDGEAKFENIKSNIKLIKENHKYELRINYNFFSLPNESLLIRYIIRTKNFTIYLITTNSYHRKVFEEIKRSFKNLNLEKIPRFMEQIMVKLYHYTKNKDSITTSVDNIVIKLKNRNTNEIKEETIRIGNKWKDFKWMWIKRDPNEVVTSIQVVYNYKKDRIARASIYSCSIESITELGFQYNDWVVEEIRTSERISKEMDLTEFYKEINKVYIKIGDSIGDINAEFHLFEKGSLFTEDVKKAIDLTGDFLIKNIKISFDNEEVIINSQANKETFRFVFKINKEIVDKNIEKDIIVTSLALCLGISQDITKLEKIEKALIVFLLSNGNLDFVGYKVGVDNPSFSLLNNTGIIQDIYISDDNQKIKIILNGKDSIFEVNENITYTIYTFKEKKYQAHTEKMPIFAIYRDEEALEDAKFETEKLVFDLNKFSTESAIKKVGIWIEKQQDLEEILKVIEKDPEIKGFEELIKEGIAEEDVEEKKKEKEVETIEEIKRDVEREKAFEKVVGKKAIWHDQETKAYKEWKKKGKRIESEGSEGEQIKVKKVFMDLDLKELPEFWDFLPEAMRVYLGWNLTSGSCDKENLKKEWSFLLCKDKLETSLLQLSRLTKDLNYSISLLNEVETLEIEEWWNNLSINEREKVLVFFLELLELFPSGIDSYKLKEWNDIKNKIGYELFNFLGNFKNVELKYKESKKGERESPEVKEIEEEIGKEFIDIDFNALPDFWNSLDNLSRIDLGTIFGLSTKADELTERWDKLLYKDDLDFCFSTLRRLTKDLDFVVSIQNEVESLRIKEWWNGLTVKERGEILEVFAHELEFNESDIVEYKVRGWIEIEEDIGSDLIHALVSIKDTLLTYGKIERKVGEEEGFEEITESNIGRLWNSLDSYGLKRLLEEIGFNEEQAEHCAQFKWDNSGLELIKEELFIEENLDLITEWIREYRKDLKEEGEGKEEVMIDKNRERILKENLKNAKKIYQSFEFLKSTFIHDDTVLELKINMIEPFWDNLCPRMRAVLIDFLNIPMTEKRKEEEIIGAWDTFSFQRAVKEKIEKVDNFLKEFLTFMDTLHNKIIDDFNQIWGKSSIVKRVKLLVSLGFDEGNAYGYATLSWKEIMQSSYKEDFVKKATIKFITENYDAFIEQLLKI